MRSFEEEQLSMHTLTPVWRMRDQPPPEWNGPDSEGTTGDPNSSAGVPETEESFSRTPDHSMNGR